MPNTLPVLAGAAAQHSREGCPELSARHSLTPHKLVQGENKVKRLVQNKDITS